MLLRIIFIGAILMNSLMLFAQRDYTEILGDIINQKVTFDLHVELIQRTESERRPLTGYELNEINVGTAERLAVRAEAYNYFEKSVYLLQNKTWREKNISKDELKGLIKSLAVSVTLFDLAIYTYSTYKQSKRMRRILNEEDSSFDRAGNSFHRLTKNVFTIKNRKLLNRAFKLYQNLYLNDPELVEDESLFAANALIQGSYYYNEMLNKSGWSFLRELLPILKEKMAIYFRRRADFLSSLGNRSVYGISKVFGNVMGIFQNRKGKLYKDSHFVAHAEASLQQLDIILEKTPFRLTDKFIPGYWGHAAIYLGTVDDLKALGIWDYPLVQENKKHIENGRLIVEALRSKVEINSLEHFSNIDDFVVLRFRTPLTKEEKKEHILRALSHVGKRYDFGFDVETGKTIVCSELHYRTFIDIDFKTTRILSRSTISVDQVAEVARSGGVLEPVLLYIDGKEVKDSIQEVFDSKFETQNKSMGPMSIEELIDEPREVPMMSMDVA